MHGFTGQYYLEYENGRSFYTFYPRALSDLQLNAFDEETISLLITAHRQIGILEGRIRSIADIETYCTLLMYYEAVHSCQMAGIDISMFDAWDAYSKKTAGLSSIQSYTNAVKYGFSHIHSTRTPLKLFCQLYRILTGCQEASDIGLLRKEQIFTEPLISVVGLRTYNPPNPDNLKESYRDFENYWNATCKYDVLIQAALIYYQFCTIQPFIKDNERITRILTNLFLIKREVISHPLLCLSYFFNHDRIDCLDRLNHVRRDISDSYEPWIKYFIKAIAIAAERTNEVLAALEKTRCEDSFRLCAIENLSKHIFAVYERLWNNPIIEARQMAKMLDISYNTAAKAITTLTDFNILEQIGEQSRYRRFLYRKLFDILCGA